MAHLISLGAVPFRLQMFWYDYLIFHFFVGFFKNSRNGLNFIYILKKKKKGLFFSYQCCEMS